MRTNRLVKGFVYAFFVGTAYTGCMDDGGWNQNEREAGGGDDGVSVELGEIALDPTGQYLISRSERRLYHAELESGEVTELTGLQNTARVTFDHVGTSIFLTRGLTRLPTDDTYGDDDPSTVRGELIRYDVQAKEELWSIPINVSISWHPEGDELATQPQLAVTEDDRFVIATYDNGIDVIDAETAEVVRHISVQAGVIDVDITPDQERIVITTQHRWEGAVPHTQLEIHDLVDIQQEVAIDVPNCSSELVISQDGQHAFLAPTRCERDPVSVIDLEAGRFVRNLPGFGPVALAGEGSLAVAFIDTDNIDAALFDDPQQIPSDEVQYHMMLIDTATLHFDVIELGDAMPRYAITPDGQLLLIDGPSLWSDGRIRILDVAKKELVPVLGAGMRLDHYAITSDSSKVFLLDDGLFAIDLATREADAEPIDFTPTDLNLTPDDALLVLREDEGTLWVYDVQASETLRSISLVHEDEEQQQ